MIDLVKDFNKRGLYYGRACYIKLENARKEFVIYAYLGKDVTTPTPVAQGAYTGQEPEALLEQFVYSKFGSMRWAVGQIPLANTIPKEVRLN